MLTCYCNCVFDFSQWYYDIPNNFTTFKKLRSKRCCSCNKLINFGEECIEFYRYRDPQSDIEELIYGDEIKLASWFMCEQCGEIYLNLSALNFCIDIDASMNELLEEYWELTKFKPIKRKTS